MSARRCIAPRDRSCTLHNGGAEEFITAEFSSPGEAGAYGYDLRALLVLATGNRFGWLPKPSILTTPD